MAHTLDLSKLDEIFEGLENNAEKLSSWEQDRLEEWASKHRAGGKLSDRQLEILETMWLKI